MEALKTFFKNQFRGERFSHRRFQKFSEDHLGRLTAKPGAAGGPIAALVGPTGAAHLNYFGNIGDVDVANAVSQGMSIAVESKMAEFRARVQKEHGLIKYVFGNGKLPGYQEFFPHGLTEYTDINQMNAKTLMDRFIAALTNNVNPQIPATLVEEIQDMRDAFDELRTAQIGKKESIDSERVERTGTRAILEAQLWKNVLTIALVHLDDEDACMVYFDESILYAPQSKEEEAENGEGGDAQPQ